MYVNLLHTNVDEYQPEEKTFLHRNVFIFFMFPKENRKIWSLEPWPIEIVLNLSIRVWTHQGGSNPTPHFIFNFQSWLYNDALVLALGL